MQGRVARGFTQADTLYFSLTDETNRRVAAPVGQEFHLLPLVPYRDALPGFGEQIAVGIELEVVAGFVE
ncbi:Uncharacterised protein [Escherichia coli]|uniref:Uncharacterized protein n=1 Tax=Escherichia coli TaxID=562 RepID=A0A376TX01_ECOLX|nr:Uncharacterised protein [Escherichia coli]